MKHETTAAIVAGSSRRAGLRAAPRRRTRSPSLLSRVSSRPASVSVQSVDVAPRPQHAEHAVELAGQALVARRRPGVRAGRCRARCRSACHAARSATSAPGASCSGCAAIAACELLDVAVGVDRQLGLGDLQPAQRLDGRAAGTTGSRARTAGAGRSSRPCGAGPRKSCGREPHERLALREREHALRRRSPAPASARRPCRPAWARSRTSPGRSASKRRSDRPCAAAPGRVERRRAAAGTRARRPPGAPRPPRPASSCSRRRSSSRSTATTSRSAWNCANDRLSRWRACCGRIPLHEVRRHVVGRVERRRERVGAARREPRDLVERHERIPQHDRRSRRRRSPAARPARRAGCTRPASGTRGARP